MRLTPLLFFLLLLAPIVLAGCSTPTEPGSARSLDPRGPGGPTLGSPDAPVTLVAFESPSCTGCRHFRLGEGPGNSTLDRILATYVANGSVRFMDRSFYLGYPIEPALANAQRCAWRLGGDLAYHNVTTELYRNQTALAPVNARSIVGGIAEREGLTAKGFLACYDARPHDAEIERDRADAHALGVTATPTFFVVDASGGIERITGVQPYEAFRAAFDRALSRSR